MICKQVLEAVGPFIFLSTDTKKLRNEGFLSPFHPRYPDILTNSAHPMVSISVNATWCWLSWIPLSVILTDSLFRVVCLFVDFVQPNLIFHSLAEGTRLSECHFLPRMGSPGLSCLPWWTATCNKHWHCHGVLQLIVYFADNLFYILELPSISMFLISIFLTYPVFFDEFYIHMVLLFIQPLSVVGLWVLSSVGLNSYISMLHILLCLAAKYVNSFKR